MEKEVSFCACRSVGYPVEIELGSFMTLTALLIMILPEKEMGLRKLVKRQCGINPIPVQIAIFKVNICRSIFVYGLIYEY